MADPKAAVSNVPRPVPLPPWDPEPLGAPVPSPLTSFVGRECELAAVTDLLPRPDVRLVTLTGPGGVGKTRLALQVAADMAKVFDGVGFVSLAAIADPDLVSATVARALEPAESGDRPPLQRLRRVLRSRRVLLVLDNFEHVVEAAPFVAELLAGCPGLTTLVTSRVNLRVSGEHEYPIEPLPVPDLDRLPPVSELAAFGAVALFDQRARAARPDFAIEEANVAAVAEVCARLDGLPLAIELAAARSKVLSPQAMLARLEHRLALLSGGSRDYPERLRAMREAIAWSYDLLTPHQQALFRRLAVFRGGCTTEAAEAVAGGDAGSVSSILDDLSSLVDSSLLVQRQQSDGEPRFSMLETIREYGLEQLAAAGEEEETRCRHANWYLRLAEDFWPMLQRRLEPAQAIGCLGPEHDNLRAALAWLDNTGDNEAVVRLAGAIFLFWYVHDDLREGVSWLERTKVEADEIPVAVRARALLGAGMLAHYMADDLRAVPWLEASLELYRTVDDRWGIAFGLLILGISAEDSGEYGAAAAHFSESLIHARAVDNPVITGLLLLHLGIAAWGQGDHEHAREFASMALEVQRAAGDLAYRDAESLGFLGLLACQQGDLPRSIELQRESMVLELESGYHEMVAVNLANVAILALASQRPAVAARLFGAAVGQREAIDNPFKLPERAVYDQAIEAVRAQLPDDAFAAAWGAGRALSPAEAVADAFAALDEIGSWVRIGAPASTNIGLTEGLTSRELEVLRLLVAGGSNREIADALFLSPRTVQAHLANLFGKLEVHTRASAVAKAYELGLV